MKKKVELIIIGSGPAGYSAAIYAVRAGLDTIIITGNQPGGQLTITTDVENYPGFAKIIQGPWLMEQMRAQAIHVGCTVIDDHVVEADLKNFSVKCQSNAIYQAKSIIIATGAQAKWLGIPSEKKFQGFGISGCATCDGFFYKNKKVLVIGGGNTAVEEAIYLTNHASEVILVHRRDSLRADTVNQERMFKNPKIKVMWNTVLEEVLGNDDPLGVTGAKLKDINTNAVTEIAVDGIFIAIGHKPNSDIFKGQLDMDDEGYVITVPNSTKTSIEGVFASGDVQDKIYRQAVTAAGTGCMAALEAAKFLR